jgi:carbonic anhydrase
VEPGRRGDTIAQRSRARLGKVRAALRSRLRSLSHLFENNRVWAASMIQQDPGFFSKLAQQQTPEYLWIGCSDSRVPANQIIGLLPGDVFVHRNVANLVVHTDLNCLSVMQFAIDVLKVRHVIVCGHYGCGGVAAALRRERHGLVDNWLGHVHDVAVKHDAGRAKLGSGEPRLARLCELNVIEQVVNVSRTTVVRDAWLRGQPLALHGWIYGIHDGRLRDLKMTAERPEEVAGLQQASIAET